MPYTTPHNKNTQENKWFSTFDLGLAATLVSLDFSLRGLDKSNPRKVDLFFKKSSAIEEAADKYWGNKCTVNARTLVDNIKMLKNRIYSK